jgi:hypothetical protein
MFLAEFFVEPEPGSFGSGLLWSLLTQPLALASWAMSRIFVITNQMPCIPSRYTIRNVSENDWPNFRIALEPLIAPPLVMTYPELNADDRFHLNLVLSLAYLSGSISMARPDITSPHLKAEFNVRVRHADTGFLQEGWPCSGSPQLRSQAEEILKWLRENNSLCAEMDSADLDEYFRQRCQNCYVATLDGLPPTHSVGGVFLPGVPVQPIDMNDGSKKITVPIRLRADSETPLNFPLEAALPLLFPLLFPFGIIPEIPGRTLREKAQTFIQSDYKLGCTRLGCQLILFLCSAISANEISFSQAL